jgi:hypothetical protein
VVDDVDDAARTGSDKGQQGFKVTVHVDESAFVHKIKDMPARLAFVGGQMRKAILHLKIVKSGQMAVNAKVVGHGMVLEAQSGSTKQV